MHRFFYEQLTLKTPLALLNDKEELYHLRKVLRLNVNDNVTLFNGHGLEATGVITNSSSQAVGIKIQKISEKKKEGPLVVLACAIPKKTKFEFIIEKCTEIGVDEIIPLKTERTEVVLKGERQEKKLSRYKTVALNAIKQSQQSYLPEIHSVTKFSDALNTITKNDVALIGALSGNPQALKDAITTKISEKKRIIIFIGPEGDFTDEEIALAIQKGCVPVSLGSTVLKVDTAAISALAYIKLFLY